MRADRSPAHASCHRVRIRAVVLSACAALALATSPAIPGGSVLGTGGALEITQLMNHIELIKEVSQQAQMISHQIRQYLTMIQNLQRLPSDWLGEVTMPYREALQALMELKASVDEVRQTAETARSVFSRRVNAMKLLDMTPQEYLRAEMQLARDRGGIYEETFKTDVESIDQTVAKAERLAQLSRAVPAISGNVEGLQNLATHATMMAGELMELRTSIQRQHAITMQEKHDEARSAELQTQRNMRALEELEARRRRDAGFTAVPFKYPEWK